MAKVFISYKHRDGRVQQIQGLVVPEYGITTARNYVDILDTTMTRLGHICKAEDSGEDMSGYTEEAITTKLADLLYDSTVTIVLISRGMHDGKAEKEQWIPWEVSYSLKENTRGGRTSATNAMLAVVLPDENGLYDYFVVDHNCWWCNSRTWYQNNIFRILGSNMFNRLEPKMINCQNSSCGKINIHTGNDHSYIHPIKWNEFTFDMDNQINLALGRQTDLDSYKLEKELS